MDDVLDAVDQHRRRHPGDVQNAFETQHVCAVAMQNHARPHAKSGPIQRPVEQHDKRLNAGGVFMRAVLFGFLRTPEARLAKFAGRVVNVVGEQTVRIGTDVG